MNKPCSFVIHSQSACFSNKNGTVDLNFKIDHILAPFYNNPKPGTQLKVCLKSAVFHLDEFLQFYQDFFEIRGDLSGVVGNYETSTTRGGFPIGYIQTYYRSVQTTIIPSDTGAFLSVPQSTSDFIVNGIPFYIDHLNAGGIPTIFRIRLLEINDKLSGLYDETTGERDTDYPIDQTIFGYSYTTAVGKYQALLDGIPETSYNYEYPYILIFEINEVII